MEIPFTYLILYIFFRLKCCKQIKLGDSWNYMPPIFVLSFAKSTATQNLVIAKLNGRKKFILRGFVCDIKRPSKELAVQS